MKAVKSGQWTVSNEFGLEVVIISTSAIESSCACSAPLR
jgi:hypothetical protein